ncbi:MAG: FAD:protein FMN transferase [Gemmatimonadaceae bacterium]|nr:FAD:protein FMN transferase [Gemmatimonadaceae bacterium]
MTIAFEHAMAAMGTVVSVQLVGGTPDARAARARDALQWVATVEATCSRFEPHSELRRLSATVDRDVAVSPLLFNALHVALQVAEESHGAFDPTVGAEMQARGFDRLWDSGESSAAHIPNKGAGATWRDVVLDHDAQSVRLLQPMLLDLGAIAKGLAVDLVARALADCEHYAVEAGGDLYVAGCNANGKPWRVAVQHPRQPDAWIASLPLRDLAMCTSGDYARRTDDGTQGHLIDPRARGGEIGPMHAGVAPLSSTVIAKQAMIADALATAVMVLGVDEGLQLLDAHGVDGIIVDQQLQLTTTRGMSQFDLTMWHA